MPELPEVETLKLQLSQLIIGKTIKSINILKPKSFIGDAQQVIGEKITNVRRFAKILVINLSNGLSLAVHLKMSGQLIYKQKMGSVKREGERHTRVIISFNDGDKLFFNDQRIFGWIKVVPDIKSITDKLGPDPLKELTAERFGTILKSSKKPIKLLLMDQEKIAGVGNIYANDALFLTGIHPKTQASDLSNDQARRLYHKLLKVLRDAIHWGGASKANFVDIYGQKGKAQEHFYVYSREGGKCLNNCGGVIERIIQGGRGTFYCPKCQRQNFLI